MAIFASVVLIGTIIIAIWWYGTTVNIHPLILGASSIVILLVGSWVAAASLSGYALVPLKAIWQAILHVSPGHSAVAPNLEKVQVARELVTSLALQVYQLASQQGGDSKQNASGNTLPTGPFILSHLPIPLVAIDTDQIVQTASDITAEFVGCKPDELISKPFFDCINLEFANENTLEKWLLDCKQNKVTDTRRWDRVRVRSRDGVLLHQVDMVAYYNKDNIDGSECIVAFLDRSEAYNVDDQSMSFVALAVHELRTPLTMLRGYIEVFEEELEGKLNPAQQDFMHKMKVSAQQLSAFINNILNVARIDENQLSLQLTEAPWSETLHQAAEAMELRARMHGKTIEYHIAKNLPTVGVDRVSIAEVVNNLLDNAIKYSGESKQIIVTATLNREGMVETTIEDFGVGIPDNILPNLFEKFYRNHRTRASVGGTGLGLYLCKAIIIAHGGNIWAKSKGEKGSTFGFTLLPYAQLADELKNSNNTGITRSAHGWIKNHSLYRR